MLPLLSGTTLKQAQQILREHRIEKLPIVGKDGSLKGLITIKDIEKSVQYPNSARDDKGRLICGAAIGATKDVLDRVAALIESQVDVVVLDSAHGHNSNVVQSVAKVKKAYPNLPLIAGNMLRQKQQRLLLMPAQTLLRLVSDRVLSVQQESLQVSVFLRLQLSMMPLVKRQSTVFL